MYGLNVPACRAGGKMSAYVLMKLLESAPSRYDRGIRLLTLGQLDGAYDRLGKCIRPGQRVLDIGCGTGGLTLRAAQRGATVVAIDISVPMLDIARKRIAEAGQVQAVDLREMGVAELDVEPAASFDVVMSGLCLSELTDDERAFALYHSRRLLVPGGLLLVADEVVPRGALRWSLHWAVRLPLAALTYLLMQTTTHALRRLPYDVQEAGLVVEDLRLNSLGDLMELVARRPDIVFAPLVFGSVDSSLEEEA